MPDAYPFLVTLDGPAGVGKSTLARSVARHFNLAYLDTGAMFRALALRLGQGAWDWTSHQLQTSVQEMVFRLQGQGPNAELYLSGTLVGQEIRSEQIGLWASYLGQRTEIRSFLKTAQKAIGQETSLVAEGRDMGSVVFPHAECKIFLDASPRERARRRWLQLQNMGQTVDMGQLTRDLQRRDEQDRNRPIAPLRPAADAFILDTTKLALDHVEQLVIETVSSTITRR
jgi:cytidylate kinase